jgi:allantoicase
MGGLSGVRVLGSIDPAARRRAGLRWFNSLPLGQAIQRLTDVGVPSDVAAEVDRRRPLEGSGPIAELGPMLEGPLEDGG